ncbi:MAG: substrate-binding domain-containing protein [Cellulomonadaceae bacterium]|jgi:ribose transport system substrate-binding protein|nr:substrate-binding domain-containing protein [Cellulomonadaceae bacterium]
MRVNKATKLFATAAAGALLLTACTAEGSGDSSEGRHFTIDVTAGEVLATGPHGEEAVSATTLELTDAEREQIRNGNYRAAIAFHYSGDDWSRAQEAGMRAAFEELGIQVVGVTDAGFSVEQQVADVENLKSLGADILISIPVDPVATRDVFQRAADDGLAIVFMDNAPAGLVPGQDYVSVVSADNYGNGVVAAQIMCQALEGEGEIGVVFHAADFFVTNQRVEAFENEIETNCQGVEIVDRGGFDDPNAVSEVADAMLTRNPNLDGIFANWDIPAEHVAASAISAGRNDLVITTVDLGDNVARMIAERGLVAGLGAQLPFDQGRAQVMLAAYGLLGKEAPPFVAVPAQPVWFDNLLDAYELVYHQPAPQWLDDLWNAHQ